MELQTCPLYCAIRCQIHGQPLFYLEYFSLFPLFNKLFLVFINCHSIEDLRGLFTRNQRTVCLLSLLCTLHLKLTKHDFWVHTSTKEKTSCNIFSLFHQLLRAKSKPLIALQACNFWQIMDILLTISDSLLPYAHFR